MQDRDFYADETKAGLGDFLTTAVHKLFDEIAPKYANRPGGYTRIIRTSKPRIGDGGEIVILQLVGPDEPGPQEARRRHPRRHAAARYAMVKKAHKAEGKAEAERRLKPAPPRRKGRL